MLTSLSTIPRRVSIGRFDATPSQATHRRPITPWLLSCRRAPRVYAGAKPNACRWHGDLPPHVVHRPAPTASAARVTAVPIGSRRSDGRDRSALDALARHELQPAAVISGRNHLIGRLLTPLAGTPPSGPDGKGQARPEARAANTQTDETITRIELVVDGITRVRA